MRIGEDIDPKTNQDEGYLVMSIRGKGTNKDGSLKESTKITFKRTVPKYAREFGDELALNTTYTLKDLLNEFEFMVNNGHITDPDLVEMKPVSYEEVFKIAMEIEYYWGLSYPNDYLRR